MGKKERQKKSTPLLSLLFSCPHWSEFAATHQIILPAVAVSICCLSIAQTLCCCLIVWVFSPSSSVTSSASACSKHRTLNSRKIGFFPFGLLVLTLTTFRFLYVFSSRVIVFLRCASSFGMCMLCLQCRHACFVRTYTPGTSQRYSRLNTHHMIKPDFGVSPQGDAHI